MSNSGYNEFFNYMPQLVQEDGSSDEDEGLITVVLKMPLLTDESEERVQQKLKAVEGVSSVHIDVTRHKVTVKGTAEPATVLAKARKVMPQTELW
ncbi:hypothetical protein MPTK1_2g12470 [Marchantia polymorpha subsp. ruderalis]|uniref:HMA domain-containing protein n=2 Tax=Marchantia polymorpha TaxID=3197 RepID=A0A176VIZ0_MARPO|nr:hypothetical protein Mapa_010292 [Marchantia paleacea]OAE20918.1 hypothetical protein AXG93_3256s1650 [Marchantia polymorpha subsp. ruderalis]PTQ43254.1 hypothetical protein MARPO_0026s0124 [Marchantia polymorpha]BBN02067.1 hypothetical protein Mp_2g12470 [Marchantia polymorpha subsp. ruderalis]|eukprot:PTQ43254.1 hypothetical protein MARPO_0026s0124 [Marchantia polymorpha]